jgi:hypothetical protein
MYAGVPMVSPEPVRARSRAMSRAMPKSITLGTSSPSGPFERKRFAGFTSRCTMPAAWAAARPLSSGARTARARP